MCGRRAARRGQRKGAVYPTFAGRSASVRLTFIVWLPRFRLRLIRSPSLCAWMTPPMVWPAWLVTPDVVLPTECDVFCTALPTLFVAPLVSGSPGTPETPPAPPPELDPVPAPLVPPALPAVPFPGPEPPPDLPFVPGPGRAPARPGPATTGPIGVAATVAAGTPA